METEPRHGLLSDRLKKRESVYCDVIGVLVAQKLNLWLNSLWHYFLHEQVES